MSSSSPVGSKDAVRMHRPRELGRARAPHNRSFIHFQQPSIKALVSTQADTLSTALLAKHVVWLRGISWKVPSEDVELVIRKVTSNIQHIQVPKAQKSSKQLHKGYALVSFLDELSASASLDKLEGLTSCKLSIVTLVARLSATLSETFHLLQLVKIYVANYPSWYHKLRNAVPVTKHVCCACSRNKFVFPS